MKFLLTPLLLASAAMAATNIRGCHDAPKCCRSVEPYSQLDQESRDLFGVDPETDDANICAYATEIDHPRDIDACIVQGRSPQCCGPFVPTRALPDGFTLNCHDLKKIDYDDY